MQLDFGLLIFTDCPCFCSIAVRLYSCQLPSYNLFTSHGNFIVFWERDITSEHHRTPIHISNTIYTHYQFTALFTFPLLSLSLLFRAFYPLQTTRPEELTTPLYSLGSKVI